MNRDLAVPLLLLLLLPLAATLEPGAFLAAALVLATFLALLVVPFFERSGPLRVLAVLVGAGPFLVYGLLASPTPSDTVLLPGVGVIVVGAAAVVVAALPRPAGRVVAVVLLAWIAGDLLLSRAGLPLLPAGFNPVREPVRGVTAPFEPRTDVFEGLLAGKVTLDADGDLVTATRGAWPRGTRLVAVAGTTTWAEQTLDGATLIAWPYAADASPLLLYPLGGIVVIGERHDTGWWARASESVASYVRRGGLLVGPAPGRAWPEPLGRRLGPAGRSWTPGPPGARAFGLGQVVRAGSEEEIRAAIRWGLEVPRLRTVFDDDRAPPLPDALEPWRDVPGRRRPQLVLLVVYAVVAAALDRILRGRGPRLVGLVAPSLALGLALAWAADPDPGVRVHAIALDLGGGGGRRVEALALAAGPEGYAGAVRWGGGGWSRVLGGRVDASGRIHVRPRRTAWAVRESVSTGTGRPAQVDPRAGFLRLLLRGPVGQDGTEVGRGGILPASVDGVESPAAWVLERR